MAVDNVSNTRSYIAGANLSAKKYHIVKRDTAQNTVVLAAAATDKLLGVLENDPLAGEAALVVHGSSGRTVKVKTGGNISKGAYVTAKSDGTAIATTTQGNVIIGIAQETTVSGDIAEIQLVNMIHP